MHVDTFWRVSSLIMYVVHLLSNWIGVGSCGSPMSLRVSWIGIIFFPLINHALFSASCADNMNASIILETTSIVPLWVGGGEIGRNRNVGF